MSPKFRDYFNLDGKQPDFSQLEVSQPEVPPVGEIGTAVIAAMDHLLIAAEQAVEGSEHHDIAA